LLDIVQPSSVGGVNLSLGLQPILQLVSRFEIARCSQEISGRGDALVDTVSLCRNLDPVTLDDLRLGRCHFTTAFGRFSGGFD
jgi:hypothetical protein